MNAPSPRKSFVSIAIVGAAGVLAAGPALADIKIGFNVPLTGFAAADGQSSLNGAQYLRILVDAGFAIEEASALIDFRYAATDEQFPTIAKFRAARRLWNRVVELSGGSPAGQLQHAVTSRPMCLHCPPCKSTC